MSIADKISKIKVAAHLFDVRGLHFIKDLKSTEGNAIGFRIVFYRRAPDNFFEWLSGQRVMLDEVELVDSELGTQYMYMFIQ